MRGGEDDIVSFLQSLAASTTAPPPEPPQLPPVPPLPQQNLSTACFNPNNVNRNVPHLNTTNSVSTIDTTQLQQNPVRCRDASGRFTAGFSSNPGSFPGSSTRNMPRDETERARQRQLKLLQRKERNKAAARRSNLNKKLLRDSLEQKSVELWEENLQLQQDIRDLHNRLRHFRKLYSGMQHVCHLPPQCPLATLA